MIRENRGFLRLTQAMPVILLVLYLSMYPFIKDNMIMVVLVFILLAIAGFEHLLQKYKS